jgi:hypothetical protein
MKASIGSRDPTLFQRGLNNDASQFIVLLIRQIGPERPQALNVLRQTTLAIHPSRQRSKGNPYRFVHND